MKCPYRHDLSLPDMPASVAKLPVDARGYPVPFFVDWLPDGTPEFRAADPRKMVRCAVESLCWICGEKLHRSRLGFRSTIAFAHHHPAAQLHPSSEPPSWSARNCPFLARPNMKRREDELINSRSHEENPRGVTILRNPGVTLVWYTDGFGTRSTTGGPLFEVRPLTRPATWWKEGRPATREEVLESIYSGLPLLKSCDGAGSFRRAARGRLAAIGSRALQAPALEPA